MAKTFLVGEGAVRLVPNAAGFHQRARKDLAGTKLNVGVDLRPDAKGFRQEARSRLQPIKLTHDVKLRADATGFSRDAKAKLDARKQLVVKAKIEATVDRGSIATAHKEMQAQLSAMGPLKVEIGASVDNASLRRALDFLRAKVEAARITANINSRNGANRGGYGAGGGGRGGSGGGRGRPARTAAITTGVVMAPIVTKAAVGGLTALVGAASQAAGALGLLPAAATAAGAGLAAIAIGAAGIGGAFSALGKESASAGNAVEQSASQQASAQRQIEQADRGLATAHRGVTRALEDLNAARKDAVRRLRDMNDELKMAPLNEREAALAIKEATKRLQEAYASGDSLEIEGAQIDLEKSKLQYDQLKKQNSDLAADVAEANKKGVEGDSQVIQAKDGVTDAVNGLKDAQDALASAMESAAESTKSMAGGVDQLAQAMAKLSPNAQDFVRKVHALGPAWTETRKFIQDRLFEGMGDAVTNLATRQLPVLKIGLAGIAGELNGGVREALGVFSTASAAKDFATTLENIRQMWSGIADSFAPFSQGFIDVTTVGSEFMPRLGTAVRDMAFSFRDSMAEWRADGTMQNFFETSLTMAKQLGRILGNVGAILYQVFSAGAEVGGGFLNTIETATAELREFLGSAEGQEGLKTFFEGVKVAVQTLAPIIQIVASTLLTTLGPALTDLVIGLGPGLVAMFEGLSQGLGAIQPVMSVVGEALGGLGRELGEVFKVLGPVIAETLAALAPAVTPLAQLLGSIIKGLAPILPLIGTVVGALVGALAPAFQKITDALGPVIQSLVDALMPVIPPLAEAFGQVASVLGGALAEIITALAPVIGEIALGFADLVMALLPILPVLADLVTDLLPGIMTVLNAILPIIPTIVQALVSVVNFIVPILIPVLNVLSTVVSTVFTWIANIIGWAIRNVVVPVLTFVIKAVTNVGDIFTWLWNNAIKPAWDGLSTAIKWAWENVISPVFESLKTGISKVGDFFSNVVDGIKKTWETLKNAAATPINWVINHVINGGIGRAWKAVDNFLGGHLPDWKDVGTIGGEQPGAPGMARGGVVPMEPGAVAGKDSVNRVLMPGEFVLSVPAVKAVGLGNLMNLNTAALNGNRSANQGMIPQTNAGAVRLANRQYGMEGGGEVKKGDPAWEAVKRGMDYAQRHQPRPYVWGGSSGPDGGTDCSGWMSEIADVVLGGGGLQRKWATGAFPGGGGTQGDTVNAGGQTWKGGLKAGMSIGVSTVHTAGTIGGLPGLAATNIESGGNTGQGPTFGGPAVGADHGQFPSRYHLPIVDGEFVGGGGGDDTEQVRKGITRWAEKAFDTALSPVKNLLNSAIFNPPPMLREVPRNMYNGMVEPAKDKLLDKVSDLTSVSGWKNRLGGAVSSIRKGVGGALEGVKNFLFDTGGVIRPGTTVVQNDTGQDEYLLNPLDTVLLRGLTSALRALGVNPSINATPSTPTTPSTTTTPDTQDVNISSVGGKNTTPGELPVPEQKEIAPPTEADLNDGVTNDGQQKQRTIDAVIAEGKRRNLSDDDIKAAIATVLVESEGEIYANESVPESMQIAHTKVGSDHDSVGPFQQRNSWGSAADRMDPTKSAGLFYDALAKSGATGTTGQRAQAVQRSAFPEKYDQRTEEAAGYLANYKPAGDTPAGTKNDPVNVTTNDDWPTTAKGVEPGDKTGSAYDQNLQGAAIGKDGSYKPDNNVTPGTDKGGLAKQSPTLQQLWDSQYGKTAQSFAKHTPLGIGGPQMETIGKKIPAISELATGVAKAAPSWAAALAGDPTQLAANVATATGAWATKTATDFASYIPENAGGMFESLLSAAAGPLIGTVNTGMSKDDLTSTMEDVQNRQARRTKTGRRRY
ncbi:tail length tape measure protein [Gordonia phage Pleakley]|uniref:Tape measure protein n=1 Tax=Gordonia phage Pleakley TaxID=2283246 RepID=A0A345M6G6_9CAUD|nr:tail length tape measure protein [Gordonia phage Pleakley]AXH49774.1 tape measure protein [Gordonia phage Fury]AXH66087.1 tape measure protein [Gordonia phage Pleakley]